MANPERGEVEIVVKRDGGEEKPYTLKLSMNAAVQLEARAKKKIGEILANAASLEFTAIRDLVFLLLQKHHAKEIDNVVKAGDFIDDAGGVKVFFEALQKLAELNTPENPPTAQTTAIGEPSTEMPVASVV